MHLSLSYYKTKINNVWNPLTGDRDTCKFGFAYAQLKHFYDFWEKACSSYLLSWTMAKGATVGIKFISITKSSEWFYKQIRLYRNYIQ